MKFSFNWLKEFVDIDLTPEQLAKLLTYKSFEVKEWHKINNDVIFEIDILPNRPDALSHYGLAYEIAALTNKKHPRIDINLKEGSFKAENLLAVKVNNKNICPRYTARVIKDVQIKESPNWLKEKLEILGLKSINNVVDATNYVMLEMGQPLHAFDFEKLESPNSKKEIIVRNAKNGEKIKVLDELGTEYELRESDLIIADSKKPIAIAGIKGGMNTAISNETKTIIIESANFDKSSILTSSKRLNLHTDSSLRFSYGIDPELTIKALNRVASLISKIARGEISKDYIDIYSQKRMPVRIQLDKEYINKLIGQEIKEEESKNIIKRLGFEIEDKKDKILVSVPSFRLDVATPEDLIEEIARIYGYNNIKSKSPEIAIYPESPELWRKELHLEKYQEAKEWETLDEISLREQMKDILANIGFTEVYNYSFISDEEKEIFNIENIIELQNPISHKFRYLRPNLLINLLRNAQNNLKFFQDIRLFEWGRVFKPSNEKIKEEKRLAGIVAVKKGRNLFFELKGLVDTFLNKLDIADHYYDDTKPFQWPEYEIRGFYPGIFAEIKLDSNVLGIIGEISPYVLFSLDAGLAGSFRNTSVAAFEFDFEKLYAASQKEREFQPIPKYPPVIRDISILVDKDVRISEILNKIEGADSKRIVQDVNVFDIYEDASDMPEGKKSVAFHIIYQSPDHTLTEKEVDEVEKNIKKALEEGLDAEIR